MFEFRYVLTVALIIILSTALSGCGDYEGGGTVSTQKSKLVTQSSGISENGDNNASDIFTDENSDAALSKSKSEEIGSVIIPNVPDSEYSKRY